MLTQNHTFAFAGRGGLRFTTSAVFKGLKILGTEQNLGEGRHEDDKADHAQSR